MITYNRYIAYNDETFLEGTQAELSKALGISKTAIWYSRDTKNKVKGWRIATSFDVVVQLLDAESGKVIMEGKARQISRRMHACDTYVSNLMRRPTEQYTARVVQKPTPEYISIMRRFGREL